MKKRILFILHVPPPVHGSSVVGEQIKNSEMTNMSFDCHFIDIGTTLNINEIGKHDISKLVRFIKTLFLVLKEIIFWQPKICYFAINAKGSAFYRDAIVILLIKLFRIKLVYHLHNKGVSLNQDKFFDNFLYKSIFNNTQVILLSKYLYPDIKKYVPESKVHYCPNGIKESSTNYSTLNVQKDKSKVNILFLSNLIESKGVFVLLEACSILKNKKNNFSCTFVGGIGNISEADFDTKVAELSLNDCVNYVGKKIGIEKEEFFNNSDIFAFPTYYHNETFGLVIIEAMQFSLPVISTFEGGIPDVVSDELSGFLVPQKNTNAIAEKLEILIKNPDLRKQMGLEGRKIYEEKFTIEIFEKRIVEILNLI